MDIVEAIEDGRLVRVSEEYAKKEGLFILKRPAIESYQQRSAVSSQILSYKEKMDIEHGKRRKSVLDLDRYRRPLNANKEGVYSDLIDNFHWEIQKARRIRGLSRKHVSNSLAEPEDDIKMIENGVLPSGNYVLLNKMEKHFGLNLRKGASFNESMRDYVEKPAVNIGMPKQSSQIKKEEKREEPKSSIFGDIEIIE